MSIFGSRKKTTVGTSVMRVIEDNALPDSVRSGALAAIMQQSTRSTDYVLEEMSSSLAVKIDRMYRYGKTKYTNGLPVGTTYSAVTGRAVVEQALEADVGDVDSITYYHLGAANLLHFGWLALTTQYGYSSQTNTLIVGGKTVYLSDMKPVVKESTMDELENGSMDQWGPLPNTGSTPAKTQLGLSSAFIKLATAPVFVVDPSATADHLLVEYCWEEEVTQVVETITIKKKVVKTETFTIPFTGVDESRSYFQVRYIKAGKAGYWTYQLNSGTKPAVEAIFDTAPNTVGTFYPWSYLRFDKKAITDNESSAEFKTTKQMLKTIGIDVNDISDAIHENPDIADVEQAMIMLAVPAQSKDEMDRRYLFDFFSKMWISAEAKGTGTASTAAVLKSKPAETTIVIRDKKFKMALTFTSIVKRRVAGKIGDVGTHDSGYAVANRVDTAADENGTKVEWTTTVPTHNYRRQITENLYEELLVTGLKMVYWVFGDYTTTADETDDILLIPLDFEIVETYQMLDREKLYGRALHYIFNSRVVTKLKWYQTGIFKAVLLVVAVVITVLSFGQTYQSIVAAAAIGASAVVIAVLSIVVKYLIVQLLVRVFVKIVGAKLAFITAVLAAAFGMYMMIDAGSVAGAPWAKELLQVSSTLSKAAVKDEFNALDSAYKEFESYTKTQTELLDKADDLLNGNVHLNPMMLLGETPDDFYQRTVHSGNIGVVGIEAIAQFVDMKLRLPKLSDNQEEFV